MDERVTTFQDPVNEGFVAQITHYDAAGKASIETAIGRAHLVAVGSQG
jgi:hypothetical protein